MPALHAPRLQALLAYLLLHRETPQPRRRIAFALWPASSEAQAHTNLRNLVHQLRHLLPHAEACLAVEATTLKWRGSAPACLDVATFEQALAEADQHTREGRPTEARAALAAAVAAYGGDLLPGCYDEWILPQRERLRQRLLGALDGLVALHEAQRDYAAAIPYAQHLAQIEPLHEAAHLRLLRLYALSGDRAAALQTYHACAATLQHELGIAPGPLLCEAYERLRDGAEPLAPTAGAPPFVGRRAEWQQVLSAWRGAARGGPRLLVLSGEAGIGKTRLADELLDWAGHQGYTTARAPCYAGEEGLLYAPVIAWLRAPPLCAARGGLPAVWLAELARLLPELREEQPGLPVGHSLSEPWQRQRLFDALRRAILGAGQPLLLLLDDIQWCDPASLDWLRYLLHADVPAPLLVVATLRPDEVARGSPLSDLLATLGERGQATTIELGPLTVAETAELAAQVAERGLDAGQRAAVFHETEGNPLFVVETVRAAAEGQLPITLAETELGALPSAATLPARVRAVITGRLARLSPLAHTVVCAAAVIGRAFSLPILARVCDELGEEALLDGLDELLGRRIIREHAGAAYDFSHPKLREVAYLELGEARRWRAHRRVAEAIAALQAEEGDLSAAQQALHYEQAGCAEAAARAYVRAAAAARRVFAGGHAVAHYRRALALLAGGGAGPGTHALAELAHEGLGEALALAGDHAAARRAFADALELVGDAIAMARLTRLAGNTWRAQARFDEAGRCYERAGAALRGRERGREPAYWHEVIALHNERNILALRTGRATGLSASEAARLDGLLERYGTPAQRARGAQLGLLAVWWGRRCAVDTALLARAEQVVALAEAAGDPHLRALVHCQAALLPLLYGDQGRAEELTRTALAEAEQMGDEPLLARCLMLVGMLLRRRGEVAAAAENAGRCLELTARYGLHDGLGAAHADLAWVAWRGGDHTLAEEHGQAALRHWSETAIAYPFQWAALLPLVAVALASGHVAEATGYARALAHPRQQQLPAPLEAALAAASVACEAGRQGDAEEALRHALGAAEDAGLI